MVPEIFDWLVDQLDTYFTPALRKLAISADTFMDRVDFWRVAILGWAWRVMMSVSSVEFVHSRNRHRSSNDQTWSTFVAAFCLQEARLMARTLPLALLESHRSINVSACHVDRNPKKEPRVRKKTAVELFSMQYAQEQKAQGRSFNWPTNLAECKEKFAGLPEAERKIFEDRAALSLSAADARLLRKVGAGAPPSLADRIPTASSSSSLSAASTALSVVSNTAPRICLPFLANATAELLA